MQIGQVPLMIIKALMLTLFFFKIHLCHGNHHNIKLLLTAAQKNEYRTMALATTKVIWLKALFVDIHIVLVSFPIFVHR